jgi:squalene-hopene/tetraprenyl-beta-curcumene cyclase
VGYGGWAYSKEEIKSSVEKGGKPPANISTTTFAIDALKACGLKEDDPLWQNALVFLKRNQNAGEVQEEGFRAVDQATGKGIKPAEKGSDDYGGATYSEETSMAEGSQQNEDGTVTLFSYGSMTYNLLRAYLFAGLPKDSLPVKLAYGWIQRHYTLERVPGFRSEKQHEMGIYYYYLSMAKTLDAWGEDYVEEPERGFKHNWREDLVKQLAGRQKEDGSWVNEAHNRWNESSPVLCTAYALNALRHTR